MLEQRERGEEPDFDGFMDRFGDFFPGNPQTLDELLEQMAQSMAADAAAAQLDDPRAAGPAPGALRIAARRHGSALAGGPARPEPADGVPATWVGQRMRVPRRRAALARGRCRAARLSSATSTTLENLLRNATQPGRAGRGRPRPGPRAARRRRGPFPRSGWPSWPACSRRPGSSSSARAECELTPQGHPRASARSALGDLFRKLMQDRAGRHEVERTGVGHERRPTSTSPTSSATRSTSTSSGR